MKIYTRTGDAGETSLLGGTRVSKAELKLEAYGTVDELNSYIGLLRDHAELEKYKELLVQVQENLFSMGSSLAAEPDKSFDFIPRIGDDQVEILETAMDEMDNELPELRNFILPGGHSLVSFCHITRNVCRRAERLVIALNHQEPVKEIIIKYLNRLSDYLFVLSRKVSYDLGVDETPWKPRK